MTTPIDEEPPELASAAEESAPGPSGPASTEPVGPIESAGPAGPASGPPAETLLSVDDVCAWLNVARHWVYDEVEARRFPHVRLGRRTLRFQRRDIQAYLDERAHAPGPPARENTSDHLIGFEDLESLD